jgi:endonuclease/exonuclease/phosphatase family metal-dependent hydrolase
VRPELGDHGAVLRSAALALCALLTTAPAAAVGATHGPTLTVTTYNIASAVYTDNDLDPLADVIESREPDIVGLQEVDRSWSRSDSLDQAAELGVRLGMHHQFASDLNCAEQDFDNDGMCQSGTAILARFPLRAAASRHYSLPHPGDSEPRGLAQLSLVVAGHRVTIFNTHLSVGRSARRLQLGQILRVLTRTRGPYILLGDLNTRPRAAELAPLLRRAADAAGLVGLRRPTVAGTRPDYVLVSRGISVLSAFVPGPWSRRLSDHRPLTVRLRLG